MYLLKQKVTQYTYTNITESFPDWVSGTSYVIGDTVRDANWYFKCAVANTDTTSPENEPTKWVKIRPSNRYAMLDTASLTFSDNQSNLSGDPTEGIIVEFDNPRYDTISLGYVLGRETKIEISEDDFATIAWSKTYTTEAYVDESSTSDWYSYYYGLFLQAESYDHYYVPIPPLSGKIRITILPSDVIEDNGWAKCGFMVCGNNVFAGCTLDSVGMGFKDFSIKNNDEFGTTILTKRRAQQVFDVTTLLDKSKIINLKSNVRKLLATSIVAIPDESENTVYDHLLLLCYIESFSSSTRPDDNLEVKFKLIETIF